MIAEFINDINFLRENFSAGQLPSAVYDKCRFEKCDLSEMDLSASRFIECRFIDCNISLSRIRTETLNDVVFENCKMTGVLIYGDKKTLAGMSLKSCILDNAILERIKLPKTKIENCRFREAVISLCDLTGAEFTGCDFTGATFSGNDFRKTDFTGAEGYSIDPEQNQLKGAKFTLAGTVGLLSKYGVVIEGI